MLNRKDVIRADTKKDIVLLEMYVCSWIFWWIY